MSAWPGMSRARGQILTGDSRGGRGFYYGGRRVLLMDVPGTELVWAGEGVAQFTEDVQDATFSTLADRGLGYMRALTPVDTGQLRDAEYVLLYNERGRVLMQIGSEAEHTIFVEMGTSKMAAQPFIRPTFDWLVGQVGPVMRAESAARGGF